MYLAARSTVLFSIFEFTLRMASPVTVRLSALFMVATAVIYGTNGTEFFVVVV